MAFSIKNDEADRLLREITALTGESLTTAVTESLRERLERERRRTLTTRRERVRRRVERYRSLVAADPPGDPVLAWDEHGLPA